MDVYANVEQRDLGGVANQVERIMSDVSPQLYKGSWMVLRGQVQTMRSSFIGLGFGILFAIVLVYLLMAVNFKSWVDPFIILWALPGALAGIVWMLFVTQTSFSVPSLMGTIMCIGVATSNSILLVTFANDERLGGNDSSAAALSAGFHEAKGDIVIAMDGDLQHAPEDIPALLAKIDEGFDIASGWRKHRVDNAILRRIPSRIANWMMAKASGVALRDFGTTFKAYRAEVLKDVHLYGELHRFIPALASFYGARIAEVPISNSLRTAGDSHYGLGRTFRVLFDIVTIRFLLRYLTRPMHFFGTLGLAGTTLGGGIMLYLGVNKILGQDIIAEHGPLMVLGGLLLLAGLIMFNTGFIGEMLMRTYFESQGRRIYAIREIRTRKPRGVAGTR